MPFTTIATNGDHLLRANDKRKHTRKSTSVSVQSNIDTATITIGYKNSAGSFKAYNDGAITTDNTFEHGEGVDLMASVSGITANSVILALSD
jgi:hypothetical protein